MTEEETGTHLEIDIYNGVSWLYVTRAIDANEVPYDYQGAFNELTGADDPCYAAHEPPTLDDSVTAL